MSLNKTPSSERVHIAFFGRRNAGKSSVVNAVTGQSIAIVSDVKGTTTDPVYKSMELLPMGPVLIIDTPGIDDEGELGLMRVRRTKQVLNKTDVAVLVVDSTLGMTDADADLLKLFGEKEIPHVVVFNKSDLPEAGKDLEGGLHVSAQTGEGIHELKETIARLAQVEENSKRLVGDLVDPLDLVVLVTPIDEAAPKGRLILPQQQVIRDALDHGAMPLVCRDSELPEALSSFKEPPALVITDSQVFGPVSKLVPPEIPLTSFSILMARYKGNLTPSVQGVKAIESLVDGDTVLIAEGCTHHRQCGDIGSVKLPALLKKHTGKRISIELSSGGDFPKELSKYRLILHCGACTLNPAEAVSRYRAAAEQGVPITNYGIAISYMNGILKRAVAMLPEIEHIL